ncbi:uncharacterized protein MICPUCDRAFT_53269 [Micromonas pusilla CCMP1545]|uniref:Predicted protein n=1 Tax=Micromonas pusilla (strain CCMP1545) TaxID=564608 RepID=C1N6F7_MICPC|nr:uncharacterized protein MICPUCDRAFT_53269 [Micromonas pusilla CCMP1545]EEH52467.1 predicted protein [Micromonas pusilla CCMP1545]|eukprot:XP_003063331.1 predicted protein [Micromonas pusilla CCMP1545]
MNKRTLPSALVARQSRRRIARSMGFLTRWIASKMEDPAEREEKWVKHMRETDAKCDELKKRWNQPTKTHGYWAKDKMQTTFKFSLDPILTNAPGKTQGW